MVENVREIKDGLFPFNGDELHKLTFLLNYAILAPSHYNAQPWRFRLSNNGLDIILDKKRVSRFVDPHSREAIISCGAAIGMIEVAAHYFGCSVNINYENTTDRDLLAHINLTGNFDPSDNDIAWFHAIKYRQTNRKYFDDTEPPNQAIDSVQSYAKTLDVQLSLARDIGTIIKFSDMVERAVKRQFAKPWFRFEFTSWQRSLLSLKPDGLTGHGFYNTTLPNLISKPMLNWFNWGSSIGKYNVDKCRNGSPTFAVISTANDDRTDWLNTGRLLTFLLLGLAHQGLSVSYMNQAIQEPDIRKQLPPILQSLQYPQLILRIGKASPVHFTSRRSVEQTIM
ncbi:hypothetical protein QTP81_16100 [Alteromonas sp. ASW11-36]|uniref:Nitroreductase n=1 Tax=Alteromonas arenosi TaxID=3055817 RepID=A0ABT7T115_9ALTE|nr:hypothetical protein [Alteromonas sp. ASW11-36]MDM7862128.1 hypothetical protein [Alteromonas sp. ASW11-36]